MDDLAELARLMGQWSSWRYEGASDIYDEVRGRLSSWTLSGVLTPLMVIRDLFAKATNAGVLSPVSILVNPPSCYYAYYAACLTCSLVAEYARVDLLTGADEASHHLYAAMVVEELCPLYHSLCLVDQLAGLCAVTQMAAAQLDSIVCPVKADASCNAFGGDVNGVKHMSDGWYTLMSTLCTIRECTMVGHDQPSPVDVDQTVLYYIYRAACLTCSRIASCARLSHLTGADAHLFASMTVDQVLPVFGVYNKHEGDRLWALHTVLHLATAQSDFVAAASQWKQVIASIPMGGYMKAADRARRAAYLDTDNDLNPLFLRLGTRRLDFSVLKYTNDIDTDLSRKFFEGGLWHQ